MAIKPSSDIILEVLKAADPVRAQATTQRLVALGAGSVDAADDFTKVLDATEQSPVGGPEIAANAGGMRDRLTGVGLDAASDQKAARVQIEFEASILKTFVDAILPKDETNVYGQGTAGDIWKSMLADQIARQIAKSGAFGISKRLFATHPLSGHDHSAASPLASSDSLAGLANRGAAELASPAAFASGDAAFLSLAHDR
ncbi:MAG: rod-binding protein [Roseiarcus sp.]|jgi:peptidoglycan hydrolase FlgJ